MACESDANKGFVPNDCVPKNAPGNYVLLKEHGRGGTRVTNEKGFFENNEILTDDTDSQRSIGVKNKQTINSCQGVANCNRTTNASIPPWTNENIPTWKYDFKSGPYFKELEERETETLVSHSDTQIPPVKVAMSAVLRNTPYRPYKIKIKLKIGRL